MACVLYISLVFSNACHVFPQCNTRLRLLYLLNKVRFPDEKNSSCSNLMAENCLRFEQTRPMISPVKTKKIEIVNFHVEQFTFNVSSVKVAPL